MVVAGLESEISVQMVAMVAMMPKMPETTGLSHARNYWTFSCQKIPDFSCQNILDFLMPGILDLLDATVPAKRSGLDKGHQDSSPSSPLLLIHPLTASA